MANNNAKAQNHSVDVVDELSFSVVAASVASSSTKTGLFFANSNGLCSMLYVCVFRRHSRVTAPNARAANNNIIGTQRVCCHTIHFGSFGARRRWDGTHRIYRFGEMAFSNARKIGWADRTTHALRAQTSFIFFISFCVVTIVRMTLLKSLKKKYIAQLPLCPGYLRVRRWSLRLSCEYRSHGFVLACPRAQRKFLRQQQFIRSNSRRVTRNTTLGDPWSNDRAALSHTDDRRPTTEENKQTTNKSESFSYSLFLFC